MAKRKTPKVKDLKVTPETITADELTELQTVIRKTDNGSVQLGRLEIQKHQILHVIAGLQDELKLLRVKLEKKYGENVDINLSDGTLTQQTNGEVNS